MLLTFYENFNCYSRQDGNIYLNSFHLQICFQDGHIFSFGLSIIGIILLVTFNILTMMLDFGIQLNQSAKWMWFDPLTRFSIFAYFITVKALKTFISSTYNSTLLLGVIFLFTLFVLISITKKPLLHTHLLCKVFTGFWSIYLLAISNLLLQINYPINFAILWFWTGSVLIIVCIVVTKRHSFRMLSRHMIEIKPEMDLLFTLEHWSLLYKQSMDTNDNSLIIGMLSKHKSICSQKKCPLNELYRISDKRIEDGLYEEKLMNSFRIYMQKCYLAMIEKFPENHNFKIGYCLFLIEVMRSQSLSLEYISKFEHSIGLSIVQRFRIHHIRDSIASKTGASSKSMAFEKEKRVSKHESLTSQFEREIKKMAYLVLNFWETVKQDQIDFSKINLLSIGFYKSFQSLQICKDKMTFDNKGDLRFLFLFSEFVKLILNDHGQAREIVNFIKEKIEKLTNIQNTDMEITSGMTLNDFSFPAIIIDVTRQDDYTIVSSSAAFEMYFGYEPESLIKKSLNTIIPAKMQQIHDMILGRYLKEITKKDLYRKKFLVGLHKSGYICPFIIHTKYMEGMAHSFRYLFAFSIVDESFEKSSYILLDHEFNITNISKNCKLHFKMELKKVLKYPNIDHWIKNLSRIITKYVGKTIVKTLKINVSKPFYKDVDEDSKFKIEIIKWSFDHFEKNSFYLLKFDQYQEDTGVQDANANFSMRNPFNIQVRDRSLENLMDIAKESHLIEKEGNTRSFNNSNLTRSDFNKNEAWKFESAFEYKGIKLLRLKNNKVFEFDLNEIERNLDKDEIMDEMAQANINIELNSLENKNSLSDFDESHIEDPVLGAEHKFMLFIQNYNRRFRIVLLKVVFFIAMLSFVIFCIVNLLIYRDWVNQLQQLISVDFILSTKSMNIALIVIDVMTPHTYGKFNVTMPDSYFATVKARSTGRAVRMKSLIEQFESTATWLNVTRNVPVVLNVNTTQNYQFDVLEQLLLGSIFNMLDRNQTAKPIPGKPLVISDNGMFIIVNYLKTYIDYVEQLVLENRELYIIVRDSLFGNHLAICFIPAFALLIFIAFYLHILIKSHNGNLDLIRMFAKVDDVLIDNRITSVHFLIKTIDKILAINHYDNPENEKKDLHKASSLGRMNYRKKLLIKTMVGITKSMIGFLIVIIAVLTSYNLLFTVKHTSDSAVFEKSYQNYRIHQRHKLLLYDMFGIWAINLGLNVTIRNQTAREYLKNSGENTVNYVNNFYYNFLKSIQFFSPEYNTLFHKVALNRMCDSGVYPDAVSYQRCKTDMSTLGMEGIVSIYHKYLDDFLKLRNKTLTDNITKTDIGNYNLTGELIRVFILYTSLRAHENAYARVLGRS